MSKMKTKLAFLFLAPTMLFTAGCDQVIDSITSGEPPPCVIGYGAECEPPKPLPPITFGS